SLERRRLCRTRRARPRADLAHRPTAPRRVARRRESKGGQRATTIETAGRSLWGDPPYIGPWPWTRQRNAEARSTDTPSEGQRDCRPHGNCREFRPGGQAELCPYCSKELAFWNSTHSDSVAHQGAVAHFPSSLLH